MPALVNSGAVGWCGISPDEPTAAWPRSVKNEVNVRRRAFASTAAQPTGGSPAVSPAIAGSISQRGPALDPVAQVGLGLAHRLTAVGHRRPQVGAERPQRAGEVGRDALGRVA